MLNIIKHNIGPTGVMTTLTHRDTYLQITVTAMDRHIP